MLAHLPSGQVTLATGCVAIVFWSESYVLMRGTAVVLRIVNTRQQKLVAGDGTQFQRNE